MPPSRPFSGRSRKQHRAVLAQGDEGMATSDRPLWLCLAIGQDLGQALRMACAAWHERAEAAGRTARAAQRGAQIHHGLREVACALRWRELHGDSSDLRLGCRQRCGDGKEPRHHALDIPVDGRGARAEGDGRDRRGGIVADAGERAEVRLRSSGKRPPWRSTTSRAQACRFLARA